MIAAVLAGIGSIWVGDPFGDVAVCRVAVPLVWHIPAGILLACIAHRFSIVEGLAGDVGCDELKHRNESERLD